MMGIGTSFDLPVALVAGAVISGCYVGDKISPLSDTTVMSVGVEWNVQRIVMSSLLAGELLVLQSLIIVRWRKCHGNDIDSS